MVKKNVGATWRDGREQGRECRGDLATTEIWAPTWACPASRADDHTSLNRQGLRMDLALWAQTTSGG
jgi:hypothetical protein